MLQTVLIMNPPTHKVSSSKRISFKFASQHKSQCYKSVKITFISRRSVSEQRQHFSKWLPTDYKLLRICKYILFQNVDRKKTQSNSYSVMLKTHLKMLIVFGISKTPFPLF